MQMLKSIPIMRDAGRKVSRGFVELELALNRKFGFDCIDIRLVRGSLEIVVWRSTRSRKVARRFALIEAESLDPGAVPTIIERLASELW